MAFLREGEAEKSKKKACDVRETEKFLKNCWSFNPICAKHAIFATQLTREWVAKLSHQNPLNKILKNFSKSFSWPGFLLASELRTPLDELATCEWVAKKSKTQIFEKKFKCFSQLKSYSPKSHGPFWVNSRLSLENSWLTIESPKGRVEKFMDFFWNFSKQNIFQKQLKYSKIVLGLINICLSMYITFNQVQSHKWIRHSFNINICDMGGYQMWDSP